MVYLRLPDGTFIERRSPRRTCTHCGQLLPNKAKPSNGRTLSDEELTDAIIDLVCHHFGMTLQQVLTGTTHRISRIRNLMLYLILEETAYSVSQLAQRFGLSRDVIYAAYRRADQLIVKDGSFNAFAQPILDWIKTV